VNCIQYNLSRLVLPAGPNLRSAGIMNPNALRLRPATRPPALRRSINLRVGATPAKANTASRLRRWIRALLQAYEPARSPARPEAPPAGQPGLSDPVPIDARELSSWRPFSPRF
jgi:hypothetical protein